MIINIYKASLAVWKNAQQKPTEMVTVVMRLLCTYKKDHAIEYPITIMPSETLVT